MKKLNWVFLWLLIFAFTASLAVLSACDQSYDKTGVKPCETCIHETGGGGGGDDDDDDASDDDDDDDSTESELYVAGGDETESAGFVALYDGDAWSVEYGPDLMGTADTHIEDLAMTSATNGFAVTSNGSCGRILKLDVDAKGWENVDFDSPNPRWTLSAVTAPAGTVAYAVGWLWGINEGQPLILAYDGTDWTEEMIDSATHSLTDVAAVGSGNAWAVGYDPMDAAPPALFERIGGAWARVSLPGGYDGDLNAVAAGQTAKGDEVYAVGTDGDTYVHFDGTDWSVESLPVKAKYSEWADVDLANGILALVGGEEIFVYDGADWDYYNPSFSYAGYELKSVSVISDDDIYAVGIGDDGTKADLGVVIHFDGTDWSEVDLTGAGLQGDDFRAVDFFDADHGWFGGRAVESDSGEGFLIDYTTGTFGAAETPMVPQFYMLTGLAVYGDDVYASGAHAGGSVILEKTGKSWNLVTDAGANYFYDIAASSLGIYAAGWDATYEHALWQKNGTWSPVDLTGLGNDLVLAAVDADDAMIVAGGQDAEGPALLVNEGGVWSAVTLPEVTGVTDAIIVGVAINGDEVWAVGQSDVLGEDSVGVIYRYQPDEKKAKGWTSLDLGITGEFEWNAVSSGSSDSTAYTTFGGSVGDLVDGPYDPLVYTIDGENAPEAVEVKDETENDWEVVSLSTYGNKTYALCLEKTEGIFSSPILISRANFWGAQNLDDLPQYIRGGAVFYREMEAETEN